MARNISHCVARKVLHGILCLQLVPVNTTVVSLQKIDNIYTDEDCVTLSTGKTEVYSIQVFIVFFWFLNGFTKTIYMDLYA